MSDIYNKPFEKYLEVKFHKNVPKQLAKLINDNLPDPSSFEKREDIEKREDRKEKRWEKGERREERG